jgi:hypothetical protein
MVKGYVNAVIYVLFRGPAVPGNVESPILAQNLASQGVHEPGS